MVIKMVCTFPALDHSFYGLVQFLQVTVQQLIALLLLVKPLEETKNNTHDHTLCSTNVFNGGLKT